MDWQPIDTAPRDKWVIVWHDATADIAKREHRGWLSHMGEIAEETVTHWMPVPGTPGICIKHQTLAHIIYRCAKMVTQLMEQEMGFRRK